MTQRIVICGVLMLAAAACGKSEEQKKAEEAAEQVQQGAQAVAQGAQQVAQGAQAGSQDMAKGLQQLTQGLQQMTQNQNVQMVDYERLKEFLPEMSGWTKSNTKGEQVKNIVAISKAETRYQKGESRIELEIVDTSFSQLMLAPLAMFLSMGYEEKSDEGYKKALKIDGQPGFEEWNKDSKRGEITAVVAGRYIVKATGHDVDNIDAVRKTVEAVNLGKLAALK